MNIRSALKPADSLTILFLLFLMTLTLINYKNIPRVGTLMLTYMVLLFVLTVFIWSHEACRKRKVLDMLRGIAFPVVCVLIIFDSLEHIVHYINPKDIDFVLIRLDYLMFKDYPTVMMESIHRPLLTDMLQVAYSTYYLLPVALGLIVKLQGREEDFDRVLFFILLCFYLSYVGYILFPALGPRYAMNHLQSIELHGSFIAGPLQRLLNELEGIKRDAFPSGHTGIVLVVSGLSYRYHRRFFSVTLPVVVMLLFSTVYCRYHYVVDVLGGVVLAVMTYLIGERYYGYWEARNNTHH